MFENQIHTAPPFKCLHIVLTFMEIIAKHENNDSKMRPID